MDYIIGDGFRCGWNRDWLDRSRNNEIKLYQGSNLSLIRESLLIDMDVREIQIFIYQTGLCKTQSGSYDCTLNTE